MLVLGRADVETLLEPRALIDVLAQAFAEHAAGRSRVPSRATIQATYLLMEGTTGTSLALLEARSLTGLRTGAAAALAARYLARQDAKTLVCSGAGVRAGFQLRGLTAELLIEPVELRARGSRRGTAGVHSKARGIGREVGL